MFLATEVPMENTLKYFWKMILQEKCCTIVVLCAVSEKVIDSVVYCTLRVKFRNSLCFGREQLMKVVHMEISVLNLCLRHKILLIQLIHWKLKWYI